MCLQLIDAMGEVHFETEPNGEQVNHFDVLVKVNCFGGAWQPVSTSQFSIQHTKQAISGNTDWDELWRLNASAADLAQRRAAGWIRAMCLPPDCAWPPVRA
ncbi:hypothetical protein OK351_08360 [Glutamicibacter sp. MNS18]|uniref:hypothetical protein n=1 Tax=Glutamicibacter sp. MNS18 TaxID=2989817 RepID=UPI00223577F8|nr:hypothetical protein [Glutamicibacter sp. MNS18]MCW4465514.1 hypothetical protein [Glutamicibacter sp. MNS18]